MKLISQTTSENLPYSFIVTSKILLSLLTAVANEQEKYRQSVY